MKKLNQKMRERLCRLSKRAVEELNECNRIRLRRRNRSAPREKIGLTKKRLLAPETLSVMNPSVRDQTLEFVSSIKRICEMGQHVHIDFSRTSELHPCGTLLFMAYVDGAISKHGAGKVTCNYPSDDVVGQLFQHVGLLERLGLTSKWSITSDKVKHWRYMQGTCTDTRELRSLLDVYENSLPINVRSQLYASLSEAITNVINHAYPQAESKHLEKKWWMFSKKKDGKLLIAICDRGIGIPDSLRQKPYLTDYLRRILVTHKKRMDETLIADAVGSPRTVTQLPHRGKGLPEMLEFVRLLGDGGLTILSQFGGFSFQAVENMRRSATFHAPVNGTLLFWEIPLEGSHGNASDLNS
ncbi:MAG: hypothetical protein AB1642_05560 [Pseudomonadota bacterium]